MSYFDFNTAEVDQGPQLIPSGTLVKVRMMVRPGGENYAPTGDTTGYATKGKTGSYYLDCEFVVIGGAFDKRRIYSLIGIHSEKGPAWGEMGRNFLRSAIESARGIDPSDKSPEAQERRKLADFRSLDGLEFVARVHREDSDGHESRNIIRRAIPCTHRDYQKLMNGVSFGETANGAATPPAAPSTSAPGWL